MFGLALKKDKSRISQIAVDKIRPNPYQPRRVFDTKALDELTRSIKQYGVMQPVTVRSLNGLNIRPEKERVYELIAGERRLRAAKLAGLEFIPAMIVNATDKDSAVLALIENLQRQNLNYIEEAEGYQNLINDYGLKQEEMASKVGKSQSAIANKLRLLRLTPPMKKILIENELTERHARALLKLPDEAIRLEIAEKVIEQGLNVKMTEELVNTTLEDIMGKTHTSVAKTELPLQMQQVTRCVKDLRIFTNTIQQAVNVMRRSGVQAEYTRLDNEDYVEISVKIPYNSV